MAQTGYTPILIYGSTTASAVPSASNLTTSANGVELALNATDGKLYYKDNAGVVQLLASKAGANGDVVGPVSATNNAVVLFDGTTGKLVKNSAKLLPTGDVVGTSDAQTLTNKLISGGSSFQDTGWEYYDSDTTNALDYVNGSDQRWAPSTGAQTLSIANWAPTGNLSELLIEGVNLGAATITWPTINWIQPDGSMTTSISTYLTALGRTLQTSGTDFVLLWTRDAGTTIYGKLL